MRTVGKNLQHKQLELLTLEIPTKGDYEGKEDQGFPSSREVRRLG